jgi:hypothetical protein
MLLSFQACPDVQGTESTGRRLNDQLTYHKQEKTQTHLSLHFSIYFTCPTSRGIDVLGGMERR